MKIDPEIKTLREKGYRVPPQRIAILEILRESHGHVQPGDVYQRAAEKIPGINEATVYRTLDILVKEGLIHRSYLEGSQVAFELAQDHHHLICRSCGSNTQIEHEVIKKIYQQLEDTTGYQLDSSHLIIFGLCPVCLKQSKKQA